MLRRVFRQRRRILFGATLLVMAMLIADRSQPGAMSVFDTLPPLDRVLLVSTILALVSGILALFIALLPGLRMLVEVSAIAALAQAVLIKVLPTDLVHLIWGTGFANLALVTLFLATYMLLYGSVSDYLPRWFRCNTRHIFRTPAEPETVWRRIVPDRAHLDTFWTGTLQTVRIDREEDDTVHAEFTLGGGMTEHQSITFLDRRAPHFCCYYFFCDAEGTNADFSEGSYAARIGELESGGCEVEMTLKRDAMRLRMALMMWFDDALGDQCDAIRASLGEGEDWSVVGHFNRQIRGMA
ncbi:hypothetical protein DDZ14_18340 [Maritimibacter sp. 55A14]|uniref:hypothetical protein n=1 Tax=Maritimibacter sp. 55A14 TaxID=2174844 RepID=UPI000D62074E|nr:hypothetical protein [Maritimibacter sp. 55A14]PWE28834.1 hypothetical protein DDZ14_18340 [Maritimibacter sp. 55A14]